MTVTVMTDHNIHQNEENKDASQLDPLGYFKKGRFKVRKGRVEMDLGEDRERSIE